MGVALGLDEAAAANGGCPHCEESDGGDKAGPLNPGGRGGPPRLGWSSADTAALDPEKGKSKRATHAGGRIAA